MSIVNPINEQWRQEYTDRCDRINKVKKSMREKIYTMYKDEKLDFETIVQRTSIELNIVKAICKQKMKPKTGLNALTTTIVKLMRKDYNSGNFTQKELSKKYNINPDIVGQVINYKIYQKD